MSISTEQQAKNAKKYFSTGEKYNFMTEELITFLGADFIAAPASTMENLHNAFEGGLIDHVLKVTKYALDLNKIYPESIRVKDESLIKICLLHQIGKAKLYVPCESEWHRKNQGKMYDFAKDIISMKVGERSAYYALSYGVKLNEEEFQSIINYDKDDSDKQSKWHNSILGILLKQANEIAMLQEKTTSDGK